MRNPSAGKSIRDTARIENFLGNSTSAILPEIISVMFETCLKRGGPESFSRYHFWSSFRVGIGRDICRLSG